MATDFTLPAITSRPHPLKRIGAWVFMGFATLLCFWLFVLPVIVVALSSVASHWSGTIFPDGFSMRWFERLGSSDFDALTTSLEVGFGVAVWARCSASGLRLRWKAAIAVAWARGRHHRDDA